MFCSSSLFQPEQACATCLILACTKLASDQQVRFLLDVYYSIVKVHFLGSYMLLIVAFKLVLSS